MGMVCCVQLYFSYTVTEFSFVFKFNLLMENHSMCNNIVASHGIWVCGLQQWGQQWVFYVLKASAHSFKQFTSRLFKIIYLSLYAHI